VKTSCRNAGFDDCIVWLSSLEKSANITIG
jgi:hypothetical protein